MAALFSTDHTTLVVTVQKPDGELRVTTTDPIIIPPGGWRPIAGLLSNRKDRRPIVPLSIHRLRRKSPDQIDLLSITFDGQR